MMKRAEFHSFPLYFSQDYNALYKWQPATAGQICFVTAPFRNVLK